MFAVLSSARATPCGPCARDFRIYFGDQLVSVAGTWMQQIAMGWLAYRLTDSALVLGLLGFARQLPILPF